MNVILLLSVGVLPPSTRVRCLRLSVVYTIDRPPLVRLIFSLRQHVFDKDRERERERERERKKEKEKGNNSTTTLLYVLYIQDLVNCYYSSTFSPRSILTSRSSLYVPLYVHGTALRDLSPRGFDLID